MAARATSCLSSCLPTEIPVKGKEDEEKVLAMVNNMAAKRGAKDFAKDFIHMRRLLREHKRLYDNVLKMFMEARVVAKLLKVMSEGKGTTGGIMDICSLTLPQGISKKRIFY